MENIQNPPHPHGWGQDPLTKYLDDCRNNQFATFANKRSELADLKSIDGMFRKLLVGAVDVRPFLPASFLLRAHSAFLAATGSVMAGQLNEAQTQLRLCIEQGAYAFFIGDDSARWERWMRRNDSPVATKAVRKEFQHVAVAKHITDAAPKLGQIYETLYNGFIDYGAHPNQMGASMSTTLEETENGDVTINTVYLHEDGMPLNLALKRTAQTGIWVLRIAKEIYPQRAQITGVEYTLEQISQNF